MSYSYALPQGRVRVSPYNILLAMHEKQKRTTPHHGRRAPISMWLQLEKSFRLENLMPTLHFSSCQMDRPCTGWSATASLNMPLSGVERKVFSSTDPLILYHSTRRTVPPGPPRQPMKPSLHNRSHSSVCLVVRTVMLAVQFPYVHTIIYHVDEVDLHLRRTHRLHFLYILR